MTLVVEALTGTPVALRRVELVERKDGTIASNDTAGASGYAPLSPMEDTVLAHLIHARCPALIEVYVHLSARIGEDVGRPWIGVQVILPAGMTLPDVEATIRDVVEAEISRLPEFRSEMIRGKHPVC